LIWVIDSIFGMMVLALISKLHSLVCLVMFSITFC